MPNFTEAELFIIDSALRELTREYKRASAEIDAALATSEFPEQALDRLRLNFYADERKQMNLLRTKVWRLLSAATAQGEAT